VNRGLADGLVEDSDSDPQADNGGQPNFQAGDGVQLKGYEYAIFEPAESLYRDLPGHVCMAPTQASAQKAIKGLKKVLHPNQGPPGRGYKDPHIDLWRCARLEGMMSMLNMFTNQSLTYDQWGASANQATIGMGQGEYCAHWLCELNRAFIDNKEVLPINPYGDWNELLLVDENIVNEINIYLLSLGNEITAKKLMEFLHRRDFKERYGIERDISHKTAC